MVNRPLEWVKKYGDRVDIVVLPVETLEDIGEAIDSVKEKGLKVVLALNPETDVDVVIPYLERVDGILILTVHPGSFCIEFLPEPLEKIRRIRELNKEIPIEVDGCMNIENLRLAKDAGATIFASGSYILKSDNPSRAIRELQEAAA